jgi:hypothetical protein
MVAAFHSGWPFSKELCVAYAMIISTAGYSIAKVDIPPNPLVTT